MSHLMLNQGKGTALQAPDKAVISCLEPYTIQLGTLMGKIRMRV